MPKTKLNPQVENSVNSPAFEALLNVRNAADKLNQLFDGGYSAATIYRYIDQGIWRQGKEFYRINSGVTRTSIRIDIQAVKSWVSDSNH